MCGRYALNTTAQELIDHFRLISCPEFSPRYNIAPTSQIPIIRWKPDTGRVGQIVRWGLIPKGTREPIPMLNNARAETVHEKPSFKASYQRHRCLIPASGFYEWQTVGGKKQPYYIHPAEGFFAFAGLLAAWKAPDGQTIVSTCIITTGPNEVMVPIHERMPVILLPGDFDTWLDPENSDPRELLRPCSVEGISAYPVRPLRTDGAECLDPVG